jgi:hypothetical protein
MLVYCTFMIMLLLYCLMLFISRIGHGFAHVRLYPNKDGSIVMLTSSIRLCYFLHFEVPNGF